MGEVSAAIKKVQGGCYGKNKQDSWQQSGEVVDENNIKILWSGWAVGIGSEGRE